MSKFEDKFGDDFGEEGRNTLDQQDQGDNNPLVNNEVRREARITSQSAITGLGPSGPEFIERKILEYNAPPVFAYEGATHWIYVINEEYNFFQRKECVLLYSNFPYEEHEVINNLPHKTLVRVLDEAVGRRNEFYRVQPFTEDGRLEDTIGFVHVNNLRGLFPANSLPISLQRCRSGAPLDSRPEIFASLGKRNWYETQEPYYDSDVCKFYVNVNTMHATTANMQARMEEARQYGIQLLFEFYNKDFSVLDDEKYYLDAKFAQVDDWYMHPNIPNSTLQFLVGIPAKYFDAVPEYDLRPADVEGEENGIARVAVFNTRRIREQITYVHDLFVAIEEDDPSWEADRYRYTGPESHGLGIIDFSAEAKKIKNLFAEIQQILNLNDRILDEDEDHRLEVGFSTEFKIQYIFYDDGNGAINLPKGLRFLNRKEPLNIPRTCAYLFYTPQIESYYKGDGDGAGYKKVLDSYTYPLPDMKPSARKCRSGLTNALKCIDAEKDNALKTYRKHRKNIENKKNRFFKAKSFYRKRGQRRRENLENFIGQEDNYEKKFKPAKTLRAVKQEALDVENIQKALDGKMDIHYDKISENLPQILIDELHEFRRSFICGQPKLSDFNIMFERIYAKFPNISDLSLELQQNICLELDIVREKLIELAKEAEFQAEQRLNQRTREIDEEIRNANVDQRRELAAERLAEARQFLETSESLQRNIELINRYKDKVFCEEPCKAFPIVCTDLNIDFPPRFLLPELPTIDITAIFFKEVQKLIFCQVANQTTLILTNLLEDFLFNNKNFVADNFDDRENFSKDINNNINDEQVELALERAGINIYNICEGYDTPDEPSTLIPGGSPNRFIVPPRNRSEGVPPGFDPDENIN